MHHGKHYRRLGISSDHRQTLLRNMVTSLIEHGHIRTTLAKAKTIQPLADKMITLAKKDTDFAWVQARAFLYKRDDTIPKLKELADRFVERPSGYTRIHRYGNRKNDCAPVAVIEYLDGPNDLKFNLLLKDEARARLHAEGATPIRSIVKSSAVQEAKRHGKQKAEWEARVARRRERDLTKVCTGQGLSEEGWEEAVAREMSRLTMRDTLVREKTSEWRGVVRELRKKEKTFVESH